MANSEAFETAVKQSKTLTERPSNEILLKIYALYKQAVVGNVEGDRPSGFDFKAAAKYDAWAKLEGKSQEEAEQEYITLINSLA